MTNPINAPPATYQPGTVLTHGSRTVTITRIVDGGYMAVRDDVDKEAFVTDDMLENFLHTGSLILLHHHDYIVRLCPSPLTTAALQREGWHIVQESNMRLATAAACTNGDGHFRVVLFQRPVR